MNTAGGIQVNSIHPTAVIMPGAEIGENVSIGAYSIIGEDCVIGENCVIDAHVKIAPHTSIGSNCRIYFGAVVGDDPQDHRFKPGVLSHTRIGDNVTLREYVTIHRSPFEDKVTSVGYGTLLMAFLAKMPLAQASGMGLNSLLGTIIGGGVGAYSIYVFEFTLGQAFMMVLISGIVFLLLSVVSIKGKTVRELVFDGMPISVRSAISVGIGLFIA